MPEIALPRWLVAIPAKNEEQRLGGCLAALDRAAARRPGRDVSVLVLANDCRDATVERALATARSLRHARVEVRSVGLPPHLANAGGARAAAVAAAFATFGERPRDLLLSTDADARLEASALARMEGAFSGGADLVLARLECARDPFDPVAEAVLAWGTPRVVWRHRVRQLAETIRTGRLPDPPLHDDYGGAGIAIRIAAYQSLDGFPAVPSEEDRALVAAADRTGLRVDRQSGARVRVLARGVGRAEGGMAATLAQDATALRERRACLVERHDLTTARLYANPSHAHAFTDTPAALEPAQAAILGIDRAIGDHLASTRSYAE